MPSGRRNSVQERNILLLSEYTRLGWENCTWLKQVSQSDLDDGDIALISHLRAELAKKSDG